MKFRPCIDIRNGKVTQIVGSSLRDGDEDGDSKAVTNFESKESPAYYARMYKRDGLTGGHVIMLGPGNEQAALEALRAYPGGLQLGGGVNPDNALKYLKAGASHVIVTSYVFKNGEIKMDKLEHLVKIVGKEKLVLDLSCRRRKDKFFVVTDRWQKFTTCEVNKENITMLAQYCSEFLVHGVDVEGKRQGVETELLLLLGEVSPIPITYAGGIRSIKDVQIVKDIGRGRVDFTIGSALDIFGGDLAYSEVVSLYGAKRDSGASLTTCNKTLGCKLL